MRSARTFVHDVVLPLPCSPTNMMTFGRPFTGSNGFTPGSTSLHSSWKTAHVTTDTVSHEDDTKAYHRQQITTHTTARVTVPAFCKIFLLFKPAAVASKSTEPFTLSRSCLTSLRIIHVKSSCGIWHATYVRDAHLIFTSDSSSALQISCRQDSRACSAKR